MEAWQERVLEEKEQLSEKKNKLEEYIHTSQFNDLSNVDSGLLMCQYQAMKTYEEILQTRIDTWA